MGKQTSRTALYATTALALAAPARAQLAPTGGQVSAGHATIASSPTTTTITQSSQNAAINWQTYNVGANQTVQYNQPNTASFTLNRVIAAQPSQIAGHIVANGRIAIVNQSGVVFLQGSTVDTSGLVVSAAGITDADFMAGRLVFGAPARTGAAISNAGNITIRQAGLAALVAPQVRNAGTITALLGRVILGGAATHTLDLYGDGLVALGVTGQVTQVQVGGHPVTALVTNTGTILAPGGTVVLTARAADGVVSTAVSAGGTIAAPTLNGQAGRVLVSGIGGDVEIDGAVSATGSNAAGGQIAVASDHRVTIGNGAVLDASGDTGGGTLAIGTTAPVLPGPATLATATTIAPAATLRARAGRTGRGGRIAIASAGLTAVQGAVTAQGGDVSGDGGAVSLAGASIALPGAITTAALHGRIGALDIAGPGGGTPLRIGDSCTGSCTPWSDLNAQAANIAITNAGDIDFLFNSGAAANGFASATPSLALAITSTAAAGHSSNINFDAGVSIVAPVLNIISAGAINLDASLGIGTTTTGPTMLSAPVSMTLSAAGAILAGPVSPNGSDKGEIATPLLAITTAGGVELDAAGNVVDVLAGIASTGATGTITLIDNASLAVTAPIAATGHVSITVTGSDSVTGGHSLFIPVSTIVGGATVPGSLAGNGITLAAAGGIAVGAATNAGPGTLSLDAQGGDITATGALTAGVLAAHATGTIDLTAPANAFASIGTGAGTVTGLVAGTGSITVQDAVSLAIGQAISARGSVGITVSTAAGAAPNTLDAGAAITGESVTLATTGGTATAATVLTAGGTLTASGGDGLAGIITLHAAQGGIALDSVLQAGTATAGRYGGDALLLADGGAITENPGGAIHAGILAARASGDILLAQAANQVAVLGPDTRNAAAIAAGGSFSLTDGQNLAVAGTVSAAALLRLEIDGGAPSTLTVQSGEAGRGTLSLAGAGTIALIADSFALAGTITAPSGLVALDVAHAGAFTVSDSGGTIGPASLDTIKAATLALGSQDGVTPGRTTDLLIDTGSAASPAVLDLTTVASTLALFASGAITEEAPGLAANGLSGIAIATLRGAAGQAIGLDSASNSIGTIAGLASAHGAVTVTDSGSLNVTGAVSAAGTVSVQVAPFAADLANVASLTIGANVTGSDVTLGSAPPSGPLAGAPGATIAVLAGATVAATATAGTLSLDAAFGDLSLAGTLAARAGSIGLTAAGGSIVEQSTGALAADSLSATAGTGTLSGGAVVGGAIDLATGTTAAGAAPLNQVAILAGLSAVGDITVTDNEALAVAGPITATAGNVALTVDTQAGSAVANTLSIGATTLSGRSVALSTAGAAATAPATAITLAAGSTVSATGTSLFTRTAGTIAIAAASGDLALAGTLTGIAVGTTPYFDAVSLEAAGGAITQAATGAIRTANLAASARGNITLAAASGTLSGAPAGNQIAATGAAIGGLAGIATQASLTLVDGTPLSVTGLVSAGGQAALVAPALTLTGTGSLTVATGGRILLAANEYTLGGSITATDGLVALGLLTAGTFSVVSGTAAGSDQIGTSDLAHISAGTLALGTTDGFSADGNTGAATLWGASTAGSVALLQILAPLNAAFPTLGLFSNGAILATGANSITATALYGAAGTGITLDATSNQIGTLAPLAHAAATPQDTFALGTTLGSIALQDAHTLFVEGGVGAPDTVAITVTGLASAAAPNALHLDSGLLGQTITLATTGAGATGTNLPQIITFGVNSSTVSTGTISVTAAQGDIDIAGYLQATLGRTAEFQALAGNIYETDAAFDTPSAATTPTGHFLVSRLAAQAGPLEGGALYSVILDSAQNILNDVVGFPNGAATRVSSATDTFSLFDDLSFNVDAGVRLEAGNGGIAGHSGLLSLTAGAGIEIDGTVQAGRLTAAGAGTASYAGSLILSTRISDISETAGARVLAGTLTAASTAGGVLLDAAGATNVIATLAGANTADTSFRLSDTVQAAPGLVLPGQDVSVSGNIAVGTGSLVLKVSQGNLILENGAALTAATSATLGADLGIVQDAASVTADTIAIVAGAEFAQFQGAHLLALAPGAATSLSISAGGGFAGDVILPNGTAISLFGIALGGTDAATPQSGQGGGIVLSSPGGDISQTSPAAATATPPVPTGTILANSLAFRAGTAGATAANAWLNSAGNSITLLTGIAGTSSATGSILLADTATLTIATGTLVAANSPAGALTINDTAAIAIDGTLAAAGGSIGLHAGSAITEAGAVIAADLTANAVSGDVALSSSGNTIASLVGSNHAGGNFTLHDNAAALPVSVLGPVAAGSALTLAIAHGSLDLEPAARLTAGTTAALSADGGIIQQAASTLTAGAATLTAGAGIAQFQGAAITALGFDPGGPAVAPSISITADGGGSIILPDGRIVALYGIALGGSDSAGTAGSAGRITLVSRSGDISQGQPTDSTAAPPSAGPPPATGSLQTGTLAFQAGSFEGGGATPFSAWLDGGNSFSTLAGVAVPGHAPASSATGSILIVDDPSLTIAAGTRVEAGNTAGLPSTLSIEDTQGSLSILGTLQAGIPLATDATHASYTGTLLLHADNGGITEGSAGAVLGRALTANAARASVTLGAVANSVALLTGGNLANQDFTFTDSAILPGGALLPHQDVTVQGALTAASGALTLDIASGNLVLAPGAALAAGTTASLTAGLGIVQNPGSITAGTIALAGGGEFAQFQGAGITATGNTPLIAITAGGGFANDVILPNGTTITLLGMALGGTDDAAGGAIRLLSPGGDISQTAPGTSITTPPAPTGQLTATTLAFKAGAPGTGGPLYNAWLDAPSNRIGTISGFSTTTNGTTTVLSGATATLSILDATALTLAAGTTLEAASVTTHPTAALLHTLSGDLTLAGTLAATTVTLQTSAGNITQPAGSITAGTLAIQAGAFQGAAATPYSATLDSAANAFGTLTGIQGPAGLVSSATGSLSLVDATGMIVAAGALVEAGNAAGLPDAIAIHTLGGPLIIAGTLQSGRLSATGTYAGTTTLRADSGDIAETQTGRLLTGTLGANAPSGAVTLGGPANVITSLTGANLARGHFVLTDDAASLPNHDAFIDGGITANGITLAITGGNLNLEAGADLTSSSSVSLAADLGILQFAGTVTGHAIAVSAGDEFAQFAHAALIATPTTTEGHVFASSLSIQAGTRQAAAGFAGDVVLPGGQAVTLDGIALGGLDSATGQGVSTITLSTPGGDISQAAPNAGTTGTTTAPPAATGTLVTDILHFQAGTLPAAQAFASGSTSNAWLNAAANRVGQLGFGTIGATSAVLFTDGEDLALDSATTLTAGGNIGLTLTGHTLTQLGGDMVRAGASAIIDAALLTQSAGALLAAGQGASLTGALVQEAGASLAAGQSVSIGSNATQTGATLTAGQSVSIGGALAQSASTLTASAGSVTINGALIQSAASTLAAGAGVAITGIATQTASLLTAGGPVTVTGALGQTGSTLAAGQDVAVTGGLTQSGSTLTARAGSITIDGTLTQTNASLLQALAGGVSIGQAAAQDDSALLAATNASIGAALTQTDHATLTATSGTVGILGSASQSLSQLTAGSFVSIGGALSQATATLLAGGSVTVAGNLTQSAGTLTARAGDVTVHGTLGQSAASALGASGSVGIGGSATQSLSTLAAGAGISIGGALSQAAATLSAGAAVTIARDITQSAGTLTATGGDVTAQGTLAQSAGSTLAASGGVTIAGAASQSASTLTAGQSVSIGGNLAQTGSDLAAGQSVAIGGSLTQTDSTLSAAAGSITIGGALAQAASTLDAGQSLSVNGGVTQSASTVFAAGLSITGSLSQTASTLHAAGDVTIGGGLDQTGSSLTVTDLAGSLIPGSLSIGGNLIQSASTLATGGDVTIRGDATQSAASTLSTVNLLGDGAGFLTVGGSLRQTQDSLVQLGAFLQVGASLTQDASTLQAGTQIDRKGGQDIVLSGAGSITQAHGSTITSNAGIAAVLSGGFSQDATSTLYANGEVNLAATTGDIAFEGLLRAGPLTAAVALIADAGNIVSNAGTLDTRAVSARASGKLVLDGTGNSFSLVAPQGQLAGLVAGGSLSVRNSAALTLQDATLSGTSVSLQAPGQSITQQGGSIAATAGTLAILAGTFTQDSAGTLSAATDLQISTPGTLSFAGLLQASRILLGEHASGTTLIQDTVAPAAIDFAGGTILTESAIPIVAGAQPDILAPITAGPDAALGLFATAADFTQKGTTRVQTLSGERRQTVQLRLSGPGGTIAFDPAFSATTGLYGPATQLLLDLRTKGMASGNIVVAGLNVYYAGIAANPVGRATLSGSVDMRTGTAAASSAFIHTGPGVNYQFNACPIQSLNCILLSPFVVPLGSPVRDLEVSVGHRREDDDDLILPNVAEQDY